MWVVEHCIERVMLTDSLARGMRSQIAVQWATDVQTLQADLHNVSTDALQARSVSDEPDRSGYLHSCESIDFPISSYLAEAWHWGIRVLT
eukprot:3136993-Rhodomonas_salina.2